VPDDERAARAARALASARADAATGPHFQRRPSPDSPQPAKSSRRRLDDPARLDSAITELVADTGWVKAVTTASVLGRWSQIVGPELAAHASPGRLIDGELEVLADSTAWATQIRLLAGELIRKLNAELGAAGGSEGSSPRADPAVRRVKVRGPGTHPPSAGRLRVRDGRGPRDTYG
jgi:predicted nucleic acid-binding Zn ribbon protein